MAPTSPALHLKPPAAFLIVPVVLQLATCRLGSLQCTAFTQPVVMVLLEDAVLLADCPKHNSFDRGAVLPGHAVLPEHAVWLGHAVSTRACNLA